MVLNRPGFGVYLTLGFPEPERFAGVVEGLAGCVDFFEFGLPTRSPRYDGPVVRSSHGRVVGRGLVGVSGLRVLSNVDVAAPFVVLGYFSDFYSDGGVNSVRSVLEEVAAAGGLCLLFPDLVFDFYELVDLYVDESLRAGLKPCFFASSRFPHGWFMRLAGLRPLFIYLGLQPASGVELPISVVRNVRLARRLVGSGVYLLAGFAIRDPDVARRLISAGADGVVVGSAVIRELAETGVDAARRLACSIHGSVHGGVRAG